MGKKLFHSLIVSVLGAFPAFGEFEGALDMSIKVADTNGTSVGGGSMNLALSSAGSRMEMNLQAPVAMKMVMLTRTDALDKLFRINDSAQTYSEIDTARKHDSKKKHEDTVPWVVKKLGEERILGYKVQHITVTHGEDVRELWTSKELVDYETYGKLQASRGRFGGEEGMVRALKAEAVDGIPLKAIVTENGMKTTIELVKADRRSVPASTFEIPTGYTKTAGSFPGVDAVSADPRATEAKKQLDETLKNMTPEQREMFEKFMKQRQGGNPQQP